MEIERRIRKGQLISPFGPCGIFDFGDESFMTLDISQWKRSSTEQVRELPRLQNLLQVMELRQPITAPDGFQRESDLSKSIPFTRFPAWLFCPKCRKMKLWSWKDERKGQPPYCGSCKTSRLAPMRFISVCENGHVGDIDWVRWAHIGAKSNCGYRQVEFVSDPKKGGGLASLSVRCLGPNCRSSNSLESIVHKDALKHSGLGHCPGRHPWQSHENATSCDKVPQVVQRGASNAYFPVVISALDIKVDDEIFMSNWTDILEAHSKYVTLCKFWEIFPDSENVAITQVVEMILKDIGGSKEQVIDHLKSLYPSGDESSEGIDENQKADSLPNEAQLKREEWIAFSSHESTQSDVFSTECVDLKSFGETLPFSERKGWKAFSSLVDKVVLAKRIRVVKALYGFKRLDPAGRLVSPNLQSSRTDWLPAIEVFGEGVFVSFDLDKIAEWEAALRHSVISTIIEKQKQSGLGRSLPEATPRYVLLHTLSHLLIRQLCFECGYSSSSLAERIYCDDEMAGFLIYTASGDSEGALGGLVREGEPDRFYGIVKTALYRGRWCSNDPICSELKFQGYGGMNKAACHSCTLLGETSCEAANLLLDRTMIYGNSDFQGFFETFVVAMELEP